MKVRPLGDKILVKRDEAATKTEGGIFLPESAKDKPKQGKVIALGTGPLNKDTGARVLQILRRLEQPPPTVVVRPPQPSAREAVRGLQNMLQEGAFAVIDRPFPVESMLELLRRILQRHYANVWPIRPGV